MTCEIIVKKSNIPVIQVTVGEDKEDGVEKVLKEIVSETFQIWQKT